MKKSKNNKIILLIGLSLILLLTLGYAVAFFQVGVNSNDEHIQVIAKQIKVIFTDNADIVNETLLPGWSDSKTFTIENQSDDDFKYDIILEKYTNNFKTTDFLQYQITSTDEGAYKMDSFEDLPKSETESNPILAYSISLPAHKTHEYTIYLKYEKSDTDQSIDIGSILSGNLAIQEGTIPTNFVKRLLFDNHVIGTRLDFNVTVPYSSCYDCGITEYKSGLYEESGNFTEDMDGNGKGETVYYFSGDVDNNWVKFGKDNGQDIWWRIIRTNEDGSVRLLYAGKGSSGHTSTAGYISTYTYNTPYNNTIYVGYMYGETGNLAKNRTNETDSNIKKGIDSWYAENLLNEYGNYLSKTAIYCNDRATKTYKAARGMDYAARTRLDTNKRPSFKCGNDENGSLYTGTGSDGMPGRADIADKFTSKYQTGENKVGNQLLEYPVALMTADEVAYAGGIANTDNENAYYYKNSNGSNVTEKLPWWTMTPAYTNGQYARVYTVNNSGPGRLTGSDQNSYAVRPVLSLKSCVTVTTGDGTVDHPYEVSIDNTCAEKDN